MLSIFWDSQGPILETYLERGTSVTNAICCHILQRGLKPEICSETSETVRGIFLVARHACPHTASHTLESVRKLSWVTSISQTPPLIEEETAFQNTKYLGKDKNMTNEPETQD
jgi:hypothetical protein